MTVKISEMISQRKDQAKDLSAGIDACLEEIAVGYDRYLSRPLAEDESSIDTRKHLELLRRNIDTERETLETFDGKVVDKNHDTDKGREQIDDVSTRLIAKLRYTRHACRAFGPNGMKRVALRKEFPKRPLRVYERSRLVQQGLRHPEIDLEPFIDLGDIDGVQQGVAPNPAKLADVLEPETTQLGNLLNVRYDDRREDLDSRSHRQQGIRQFDHNMRAIVRIIQGTLALAGRDDLVRRFSTALRRFTRRPRLPNDEAVSQATETEHSALNPSAVSPGIAPTVPDPSELDQG